MKRRYTYVYWFVRDHEEDNGLVELPECSLGDAVEEFKKFIATDVMYCGAPQIHHHMLATTYRGTETLCFEGPVIAEALGDRTVFAHFINLKETRDD